jgi:cation transport ATPase
MNDQNPAPNPQPSTPAPEYHDWREQRHAERMARREARWQRHGSRRHGWIWGIILVILGVALLLENLGIRFLENWWALFILIPAFWAYVGAWDIYQDNNRLTRRGASALTVAILLTVLAFVFLLNVAVGVYWPVLLIAGGLALLMTGLIPE